MTDNERAVIEAAVEWQQVRDMYGENSRAMRGPTGRIINALNELHNEHDGRWEPSE